MTNKQASKPKVKRQKSKDKRQKLENFDEEDDDDNRKGIITKDLIQIKYI